MFFNLLESKVGVRPKSFQEGNSIELDLKEIHFVFSDDLNCIHNYRMKILSVLKVYNYGNIYNFTGPQEKMILVNILLRHFYNKDKCGQFEDCTKYIQDYLHTKHKTSKFTCIRDFLKEVYKKVKAIIENARQTNYIYKLGKTINNPSDKSEKINQMKSNSDGQKKRKRDELFVT